MDPQPPRNAVVLVVDDDLAIRETIANVLRDERYLVAMAGNGNEAITLVREGLRPTVVLLDLWMPELDGRATLKLMRADALFAGVTIIILTADAEARHEQLIAGADGFLPKPVDLDELLDVVEQGSRPHAIA